MAHPIKPLIYPIFLLTPFSQSLCSLFLFPLRSRNAGNIPSGSSAVLLLLCRFHPTSTYLSSVAASTVGLYPSCGVMRISSLSLSLFLLVTHVSRSTLRFSSATFKATLTDARRIDALEFTPELITILCLEGYEERAA